MKLFTCFNCGNLLYFENTACTSCGAALGFFPDDMILGAMTPTGTDNLWLAQHNQRRYKMCENYAVHQVCNWMVAQQSQESFCPACRLNRTIPDLSIGDNIRLWHTLEIEKHRLVYSLLRMGLPLAPRSQRQDGLEFDFLADNANLFSERKRVLTGHAAGLITLNIAEADPVLREKMRNDMAEPYRTLLGHFRHEAGHYYWGRLVAGTSWHEPFRQLFGDETADYGASLERYYAQGPAANWQESFVSSYASTHPWEDWAETWAHYLHIADTLETASQFGLRIAPSAGQDPKLAVGLETLDPYQPISFDELITDWLPLTFALNSLNRSMGHALAYPFVIVPAVMEKLAFIHRLVSAYR
ncbi:hypothetical protein SAMN05660860_02382 [Geoalkalibacter ferrihydriticus]|uniref:Zinc-ribbon domain-containing protein n=2 Tax=Geoalkalibacter ferrihydriticus TaxID=392333 RepID=A0A0C2HLI9_9BACT|nr:putative zinc-binding peptidase [Geoalkalibacter ferrihydriticus]KIH77961.1 hypothetical protein GFER_04960 [Geoalkalibacter ferrihydriticus DSM 17813]SDM35203.1 hypothetical protein SAMN05660860_02382 [Geoalkalibacter ferrihydriticus]